jgi:hypothetical protein
MLKLDKFKWGFIVIFALSIVLRLGLSVVNHESNDNHMLVIYKILETGRLPILSECRECFHPKLFYVIAAGILQVLNIHDINQQILIIQFVNCLAGILVLIFIYKIIREYPSENEFLKLTAFGLVALNPKIIAINSQVSNDTFVILFSTLALYFAITFLKSINQKQFWLSVIFTLLAVATKVTGIVVFGSILLGFLAAFWLKKAQRPLILKNILLFVGLVVVLTALNPLSQVITNIQKFGAPFVSNDKWLPLPEFFQQTTRYPGYFFRPGIVSIQDGFFTFKFSELLKYPMITNGKENYPPHRTSFWTMLFADANSLHFQNWPLTWQAKGEENYTISRGIFFLAILPALILILGFVLEIVSFKKSKVTQNGTSNREPGYAIFLFTVFGSFGFLMLSTLLYRDFSYIKLIYILPGLLAFTQVFLRGLDAFLKFLDRFWPYGRWIVFSLVFLLSGFYVGDVLTMIFHLI